MLLLLGQADIAISAGLDRLDGLDGLERLDGLDRLDGPDVKNPRSWPLTIAELTILSARF
jgi:hypothetical protein